MLGVGDINIPNAIIDHEVRIRVLERVMDHLAGGRSLTQLEFSRIQDLALADVQKKWPNMGIQRQ